MVIAPVGASRCGGTLPAVETEVTETPTTISVSYIDVDETISFTDAHDISAVITVYIHIAETITVSDADDISAVFPVYIDIAETITVSDATSANR